jgi:P-type Cu2+ transporter
LVRGAKCAGCLGRIEAAVRSIDGIEVSRLNLSTGRFTAQWQKDDLDPRKIVQNIVNLGYGAMPFQAQNADAQKDKESRELLITMAVAGAAAMFVMMIIEPVWLADKYGEMSQATRTWFHWLAAMVAIPCGAYAGMPFFKSAWSALKNGHANMDVPISLAIILTTALSLYSTATHGKHTFFDAVVMLEFFLLIGRYLDHHLRVKSRIAAQELLALQAVTAQRINPDGTTTSVAVSNLEAGDTMVILPGDRFPVDGIITEGVTQADFSMITGETAPVLLGNNQEVRAGVLNISGRVILKATKRSDDSFLSEIARLIEAGEQSKSKYVRIADKAAQLYVPVVHGAALITFVGWILFGSGFETAIWNACAVLIITCPCALGLAVPAVQVVASGRLFKNGILVKSGDALERLASVTNIVFDKTGVLTLGQPHLINQDEIKSNDLAKAALLARASRHPLARAIARLAGPGPSIKSANEVPGFGVEGELDGKLARMGRAEWVGAPINDQSETELWFKHGDDTPIRFEFEDTLRKDTIKTITALKQMGYEIEILSGDRLPAVEKAAKEAGIEKYRGQLSPFDKAARLDELRLMGKFALMIGDGLNDAPSLAKAHVSIAPGAAADASQSAADLVFQGQELMAIVEALKVGKLAKARVIENFWFSAIYNLITVPFAIFGMVTPQFAAIAMSSSSIIVSLNALRLYTQGKK